MKKLLLGSIILTASLVIAAASHAAQFVSGSTGADGAFSPTSSTNLQLPPDGVFNFTTVNIPTGVTVTFKRNAANTPVYILATGDVTIAGTININGETPSGIASGAGGPGGFDGGQGGKTSYSGGAGFGPSGGAAGTAGTIAGSGSGGSQAANDRLIPIIGGSGGGGGAGSGAYSGGGGGGGGGAILIASSGTITVSGSITSNGGTGGNAGNAGNCDGGAGGSGGAGGAIKLIANTISGNGTIYANGGSPGSGGRYCVSGASLGGASGGEGKIRLEFNNITRTASTSPTYTFSFPGSVFYPNIPTLAITSIGGVAVPSGAAGSYGTPDISLPSTTTNPVQVGISATNIPVGTTITVSVIPQVGSAANVTSTGLSGSSTASTATANVTLSSQYPYVLMAKVTFTVQMAMYHEGERIDKAYVATSAGGGSQTVYITESGREIPAERLIASAMER